MDLKDLLQQLLDVRFTVQSLRTKFLRLVLRTLDLLLKLQVPSARSRVTWMMIRSVMLEGVLGLAASEVVK